MSGKIYELLVDEDGLVKVSEFELLSEYLERCKDWIGLFCVEFEYSVDDLIDMEEGREVLGGWDDEEVEKFEKEGKRLNDLIEKGKGWKVLCYSVEVDMCWVVMKENKIERFLKKCKEMCGE